MEATRYNIIQLMPPHGLKSPLLLSLRVDVGGEATTNVRYNTIHLRCFFPQTRRCKDQSLRDLRFNGIVTTPMTLASRYFVLPLSRGNSTLRFKLLETVLG